MVYLFGVNIDYHHNQQQKQVHYQNGMGNSNPLRNDELSSNGSFQFPQQVMISDNNNTNNIVCGSNVASNWFVRNNHHACGSLYSYVRNNSLETGRNIKKSRLNEEIEIRGSNARGDMSSIWSNVRKQLMPLSGASLSACNNNNNKLLTLKENVVKVEQRQILNIKTTLFVNLIDDSIYGSNMQEHDFFATSKTFTCKICGRVFSSARALEGHKKAHKGEPLFIDLTDNSIRGSVMQEDNFYATSNTFSCIICKRKFLSSRALGGHKKVHKGKRAPTNHQQEIQETIDFSSIDGLKTEGLMMKLEDSVGESSSINVDMKSNPIVDKSNMVGTCGDHHPTIKEEA